MVESWVCPRCTFCHTGQHYHYLSCGMCGKTRLDVEDYTHNSSSPTRRSQAAQPETRANAFKRIMGSQSSLRHKARRKRPRNEPTSQHPAFATQESVSKPPLKSVKRTIAEALRPRTAADFVPRARHQERPGADTRVIGEISRTR